MQAGPSIVHPVHNTLNVWLLALYPRLINARGEEFLDRYPPPNWPVHQCLDARSTHYPFSVCDGSQYFDVTRRGKGRMEQYTRRLPRLAEAVRG